MRGTSLSQADPFVKMSVTAVLSGMASKASGGDFVQGAMSAMVVWLYNDMTAKRNRTAIVRAYARRIASNSAVRLDFRKKLIWLLKNNKIYYAENQKLPFGVRQKSYGYAQRRGLTITSKMWERGGYGDTVW